MICFVFGWLIDIMILLPNSLATSTLGAGPSSLHSTRSSDMSNPTLVSLRKQKNRILKEIYGKNDGENNVGLTSLFSLYPHVENPIHFEDAIIEEKLVERMDEKIDDIEKNQTWDLVSILQGKEVIVWWITFTKQN